jgi:hypothetical protein
MLTFDDHLVIIYGNDNKIYMGQSPRLAEENRAELAEKNLVYLLGDVFEIEDAVEVRRFDQVTQNGGIASMQKAAFIVPFMQILPRIKIPASSAVIVKRGLNPYWYNEMVDMLKSLVQDQENIEKVLIEKHSKISAPNEQDILSLSNKRGLQGVPNGANTFRPDPRKN